MQRLRPDQLGSGLITEASLSAIGIFDSGIGGLTVLRALKEALPEESFIYLGDTARLPYGSKSPETIRRYLGQNIAFLKRRKIKALVVACNSASTVLAGNDWGNLPIYGVIEPGAKVANQQTRNGRIGILGTRATVTSAAYVEALLALNPHLSITQQACPLLVPLVEEGWQDDDLTRAVLARYLQAPLDAGVDTLILGCTHYPVLKAQIAEMVGPEITLVDSARAIAEILQKDLQAGRISLTTHARAQVWTTDANSYFREVGERILAPFTVEEWLSADLL